MSKLARSRLSLSYSPTTDMQDTQQSKAETSKKDICDNPSEDENAESAINSRQSKLVQLTLDSLFQKGKKTREDLEKMSRIEPRADTSGGESTPAELPPSLTQFKKEKSDFLRVVDNCGRFPCIWCGRSFSTAYNLSRHCLKHKDKKHKQLFPCPECSNQFDRKDSLQKHLCSHKNDRPHVCGRCRRRFKHKCHLNVHIKLDRCLKEDKAKYY